ncbi:MAG: nuclear transport factor 2 family protein, partial [Solirubrobacterales bacterium]|nr:nuclear transport factor 2 family protein [Solirubrobacterales bacterium]
MCVNDVLQQYLDAARRGDFEAAFEYFADDVLARIPGRSPQAGSFRVATRRSATSRPHAL